jgi:hypothetical protein
MLRLLAGSAIFTTHGGSIMADQYDYVTVTAWGETRRLRLHAWDNQGQYHAYDALRAGDGGIDYGKFYTPDCVERRGGYSVFGDINLAAPLLVTEQGVSLVSPLWAAPSYVPERMVDIIGWDAGPGYDTFNPAPPAVPGGLLFLKSVQPGGKAPFRSYQWPMPEDGNPGDWTPQLIGKLSPCRNGYHAAYVNTLAGWTRRGREVYLFEADASAPIQDHGGRHNDGKIATTRARLVKKLRIGTNKAEDIKYAIWTLEYNLNSQTACIGTEWEGKYDDDVLRHRKTVNSLLSKIGVTRDLLPRLVLSYEDLCRRRSAAGA